MTVDECINCVYMNVEFRIKLKNCSGLCIYFSRVCLIKSQLNKHGFQNIDAFSRDLNILFKDSILDNIKLFLYFQDFPYLSQPITFTETASFKKKPKNVFKQSNPATSVSL